MLIKEDIERVRVLRLANPPSNVLNRGLLGALRKEVAAAASVETVRCLLLSSSYTRYFSTGLDLSELTALPPERQIDYFEGLFELYRDLLRLPKPTLAAISGTAFLGGWILAMACDFRLLAQDGRIALSEIRMGLTPTAALIQRLSRMSSSPSLVKEMVLRGKTLRAEQALSGGFVDELVAPEKLEAEALSQAKSLAKLPPDAYAAIKEALERSSADDMLWRESRAQAASLLQSRQVQEGLAAMRDKRRPRWGDSDV